jgi:SAM-dependent methyltransferase
MKNATRNGHPLPTAKTPMRLHIGCGTMTPDGWINLDGSWNARLANHGIARRIAKIFKLLPKRACDVGWTGKILSHDLRKPLPFKDGLLCAIYGSHVLEHLYLDQADELLKECFRTLEPGDVLRLVVPDLRWVVSTYLAHETGGRLTRATNVTRADELNQRLLLRTSCTPVGNILYKLHTALTNFHSHKWMYDVESKGWHISKAGFVEVGQRTLWVSNITDIKTIEKKESFEDDNGICIEAIKPKWIGRRE